MGRALGTGRVWAAGGRAGLVRAAGDEGAARDHGEPGVGAVGPIWGSGVPRVGRRGALCATGGQAGCARGPSPAVPFLQLPGITSRTWTSSSLAYPFAGWSAGGKPPHPCLLGARCCWKHRVRCNLVLAQCLPLPGWHHRAPEGLGVAEPPVCGVLSPHTEGTHGFFWGSLAEW